MPRMLTPEEAGREAAFAQYKDSPMPMVTLTRTFDVNCLRSRKERFNALLCWCIGAAASRIPDFLRLPVKTGFQVYDRLALNVILRQEDGTLLPCDVSFTSDLQAFLREYDQAAAEVKRTGVPRDLSEEYLVIGTSALPVTELDSAVNAVSPWANPFLIWGRVRPDGSLPISFQFHHAQMDGYEAAVFLETLQTVIHGLR